MNRHQFWVLTYSILWVGSLFLGHIFLAHLVREEERKAIILESLAREGTVYDNRWQQMAIRVYQASQQDPALREVLVHQKINIVAKPSVNVTTPAAQDTSSPLPADR